MTKDSGHTCMLPHLPHRIATHCLNVTCRVKAGKNTNGLLSGKGIANEKKVPPTDKSLPMTTLLKWVLLEILLDGAQLDHSVRWVFSTKGPDSSVGAVPVVNCPDVDHMEEEVQVSVQVEVEREEQGIGETHGKEQGEEQREQIKRTTWMTMEMT